MVIMRKSRLSSHKQDRLTKHFVVGTLGRWAASLVGINFKTSAYYFHRLQKIFIYNLEQRSEQFISNKIEVDETLHRNLLEFLYLALDYLPMMSKVCDKELYVPEELAVNRSS